MTETIHTSGHDVVMLTSAHAALDDRIFYREAKTLAEAGLSVSIVGQHSTSESVDGIAIYALPLTPSRIRRLMRSWQIMRMALQSQGKLYIFHDPELFAVGLALRLLGKKVAYDSHENLPKQLLQKEWLPRFVRYLLSPAVYIAEWVAASLLSGIIVATPVIQRRFPPSRTKLVRNFPTKHALDILGAGEDICSRANIAIYAGGLSRIRGIREMIEAFRGLPGAELWLVGKFEDPQFESEVAASRPSNVKCLGWKTFPEALKLYNCAKIGMLPLYPMPNHRGSLPVKLFEYLGAGLPVIISNFPEFSPYADGCGLQVDPFNISEIREAVIALMADDEKMRMLSVEARHRAVHIYCWDPEGLRLVQFCRRLIANSTGASSPSAAG